MKAVAVAEQTIAQGAWLGGRGGSWWPDRIHTLMASFLISTEVSPESCSCSATGPFFPFFFLELLGEALLGDFRPTTLPFGVSDMICAQFRQDGGLATSSMVLLSLLLVRSPCHPLLVEHPFAWLAISNPAALPPASQLFFFCCQMAGFAELVPKGKLTEGSVNLSWANFKDRFQTTSTRAYGSAPEPIQVRQHWCQPAAFWQFCPQQVASSKVPVLLRCCIVIHDG
jgi:hypothetical protein